MTRAQRHMQRVAAIACLICDKCGLGNSPAEVHHIGDSAERSDWLVVPLCPTHHRGSLGFHGLGEREFNRKYATSEIQLLAETIKRLAQG